MNHEAGKRESWAENKRGPTVLRPLRALVNSESAPSFSIMGHGHRVFRGQYENLDTGLRAGDLTMDGLMADRLYCWGNYKISRTHDFHTPRFTFAFISLSKCSGDGVTYASVLRYKYRDLSGKDQTVNVPDQLPSFA